MLKRILLPIMALFVLSSTGFVTHAADPFYGGKTIRIVVGYPPGGGYDSYARVLAQHMGKHIPGKPTIVVENMPGSGSLLAANYMYKLAQPDGLTIGHFNGGLFFNQVLGQTGVSFDAMKFEFIGACVKEGVAYAFTKSSGITSVEKWAESKTPVKMGGVGKGAFTPDNVIQITKVALGLPIEVVTGYPGTADIRVACAKGELAGCSWAWGSMRSTWRQSLEKGDVVVVLQAAPEPFPDLPKIPTAISLAKTDENRQLIEVGIHSATVFARPFVCPPGTPKELVQTLSKALQDMFKDKECIAEVEKAKLEVDPVTGEQLENAVKAMFKMNPTVRDKLKAALSS